ncbi:MAG TPA: aspartate aminotransferase family protein [Rubrobacteraceae bacterium]|nr:aspartate aminotransferase family protein [Rubrobacteraceae bacterium]
MPHTYKIETRRSRALFERLSRSIPGGNTRSLAYFPPHPLAISHGSGCRLWDVDGNEFVDLLNNYTATVHGHAVPAINEAMSRQAALGTVFPAPAEAQAELAERIVDRVASVEKVRFTNSGTEAVMMAVRAARAFTGREKIIKAEGGYHGMWEQVPVSWPQDALPGRRTATPEGVRELVRLVDYNDVADLEAAMDEQGGSVAAIILEPVTGTGVLTGKPDYFAAARRLADEHGALLICDEVITLRLGTGGYQEVLGVRPDLTTMGKIIGGGLPVGAFGGREDVMSVFDPRLPDHLHHSGTFNGNLMTMAAGRVALDLLTKDEIQRLNALGERLADGLHRLFAPVAELGAVVTSCGSLVHLNFETQGEVRTCSDLNLGSPVMAAFHLAALDEGVYIAPRCFMNTSTAMDEQVIDDVLEACSRAMARVVRLFGLTRSSG